MLLPTTLHIAQQALQVGKHIITLTLQRADQSKLTAKAEIKFALTSEEQEDLRWYMEEYLIRAESVEEVQIEQIEQWMKRRGEELYTKILAANMDTQAIWFAVREQLADLRVEITTSIAEAASIPWELMRDPQSDSAIALRVQSFVRVQSDPNVSFVPVPKADEGRIRLLYIVCRPGGRSDVGLRAVANRLLQDLGEDLARFDITALRPPTFEQLQKELADARAAGRPYHVVHFDGHGTYEDLSKTPLADWQKAISALTFGGDKSAEHGYLMFEHPDSAYNIRPVSGEELGKLLHDTGVPVLVLNACQSAMHKAEGGEKPDVENVHDEVRAIGSLAQAVIDQGIPGVLGMRYSVFVVTAAQYIGQLYASLAQGRPFGQAASEGRKNLALNPDRWVGLQPRPLQDWFVPIIYEAAPINLLPPKDGAASLHLDQRPELDPVQTHRALRRYVPDTGFVGRDETLLLLDRAFDHQPVVLLHAYAGQGKTATAVEFARWYSLTGGLGPQPRVLFTSFETHTALINVLSQFGQMFAPALHAQGIEWHAIDDIAERRRLVLLMLRQVPVLWIWDNVELIAGFPAGSESAWTPEEQADLADLLKQIKMDLATKAKILLTSRRDEQAWLAGIPHRVPMPRMTAADAARLALQIGDERKLERSQIVQWQPLLDYCAGNPLTLRIIAGHAVRMGLRDKGSIVAFIQAMQDGEQRIQDADEAQGRDHSLSASLAYGFRNAFLPEELPLVALLCLFQGTVDVDVLIYMGNAADPALPELKDKTKGHLTKLLNRALDDGLLSPIGGTLYSIHPALPWFLRQLFTQHYNGQAGRSTAAAALHAWAQAIGRMSCHYHTQFSEGNRDFIQVLGLEEANLLYARRLAHRYGWYDSIIPIMQGLDTLYDFQGRQYEWSRLVAEITPDFCTPADFPIPGREEDYPVIIDYRVRLARYHERDFPRAAALQRMLVAEARRRAAPILSLPSDALLNPIQRNHIRNLGVSMNHLGQFLIDQQSRDCLAALEESLSLHRRIDDTTGEAVTQYFIGHAYMQVPAIRNLKVAEAAFQQSLALHSPKDALGRSKCIKQIGRVHYERFIEARRRGETESIILKHAKAAERSYCQALDLCPPSALDDLSSLHKKLGNFYSEVGMINLAREYYDKDIQICELMGDRYGTGETRYNIAIMYFRVAIQEVAQSDMQRILLLAQAYALAALNDFKYYEGCVAVDEADAQRLLKYIAQTLTGLSP